MELDSPAEPKFAQASRAQCLISTKLIGTLIGVLLGCFTIPNAAFAWGDTGHRIICEIAILEMEDSTAQQINSLIAQDPEFTTFSDSCTYPDHPRKRGKEHYVNLSRNAEDFTEQPCPLADKCVTSAIMKDIQELALTGDSGRQLDALKFLGHWIGDVHQPLHVSFKDDRGGNEIKVSGECSGNLHAVWDTCMIESEMGTNATDIATQLANEITDDQRSEWTNTVNQRVKLDTCQRVKLNS